jgi:hypothetical protein
MTAASTMQIQHNRAHVMSDSKMPVLMKFSTHHCHASQEMAVFDLAVAARFGMDFIDVNMNECQSDQPYRKILLHHHPIEQEIAYPTYLLVHQPDGDFRIQGEIVGSLSEASFRSRIAGFLETSGVIDPGDLPRAILPAAVGLLPG